MNKESPSNSVMRSRYRVLASSVISKVVAPRRFTSPNNRSMCRIWYSIVLKKFNPRNAYGLASDR